MVKVYAAVGAYVLFFYLLSRLNVYICLFFRRRGSDDHISLEVRMLGGLVVYSLKVPVVQVAGEGAAWFISEIEQGREKARTHPKREQRFVKNVIKMLIRNPRRLEKIIRSFRQYKKMYRAYMNGIAKGITCERFEWRTRIGSEEADVTAIASGGLWALKMAMLASLCRRIPFATKPVIQVSPAFGRATFETELNCIFRVRLGHVINATTRFVTTNRKEAVNRV